MPESPQFRYRFTPNAVVFDVLDPAGQVVSTHDSLVTAYHEAQVLYGPRDL